MQAGGRKRGGIMCEEDMPGYGGMEAAASMGEQQILVSVLLLLWPLDLSVLVFALFVWLINHS